MASGLHLYFIWELLAYTRTSTCSPWLWLSPDQSTSLLDAASPPDELCFVCVLISIHRNFHLRWSRSPNPPSRPEHLEGVNCETQLRFIYHPNPHRLLTLPAGSTLTALVVRCEKSRLTPIKQRSCRTDSSTALPVGWSLSGKTLREEGRYHWLVTILSAADAFALDVFRQRHLQLFLLLFYSVCAPDTEKNCCQRSIFKISFSDFKLDLLAGAGFTEKSHKKMKADFHWTESTNWNEGGLKIGRDFLHASHKLKCNRLFFYSPLVQTSSVCVHW